MDLRKFYGHVSIDWCIKAANAVEFPWPLMALCLEVCFGPRFIRLASSFATIGVASTGLLAGCPLATSFARACLYPMIKGVIAKFPVVVRQYIDGMRLRATAVSGSEAA